MAGGIVSLRGGAAGRRVGLRASASRAALIALIGAGASSLALPAWATNFNVGSASQLQDAINGAANGDTITFTSDIGVTARSESSPLTKNITINGAGHALFSDDAYRGFIVGDPHDPSVRPTVAINNLTIFRMRAGNQSRGASGSANGGGGGGGGAGLGGALLVLAGANVTVTNVVFRDNRASGNKGGGLTDDTFPGGGGGGGGYLFVGREGAFGYGGHGGLGGGGDGGDNRRGALAQPGGFGGGGGGQGAFRNTPGGSGGFGGGGGGNGFQYAPVTNATGGFGGADANGRFGGGGAGMGGAVFVQQGGTLTFGGSLTVSGNSAEGGQTPGGGAPGKGFGSGLFLQGNGSFTLAPGAGQTQTISDVIADQTGVGGTGANAGSWQLVKDGAGATLLTGANAYSGATLVNGGTLLAGSSSSLPLASAVTLNGGMLGPGAGGTVVVNNAISLGPAGGTGFYAAAGSNLSLAGVVSGGQLVKSGAGDLTLAGRGAYSGGTLVDAGRLLLGSSGALPAASAVTLNGGALGVNTGGTTVAANPIAIGSASGTGLYAAAGSNLSLGGVVSGGQLVKLGAGDVTLTGANTFNGAAIAQGVLRFNTEANLGGPGDIIINGGSVGSASSSPSGTAIDRNLVLLGPGGVDVGNTQLAWSGPISGSGLFVKSGLGGLALTGINTYSGGTRIVGGPLSVGADAELGRAGTGVNIAGGWFRASDTFATSRPFSLTTAGGVEPYIEVVDGRTLTVNGIVSGDALHKDGDGTLVLNGANTYSKTYIEEGAVVGNAQSIRGDIAFQRRGALPSVRFDQEATGTFSGNITGSGALIKTGSGLLTLGGTNTYTGGTFVQLGTLQGTTNSLQGNIVDNGRAVVFDQSFDGTFGGAITGPGALAKEGPGSVSMTGANQVSVTSVNQGALSVNGGLNSPKAFVNDGGALTVNGAMTSDEVSVNAGGAMAVNGSLTSPLVTVHPRGELQGHGNVTGFVDTQGGEIEPGNSIGTLHIFGPLEMEPHSEYQVQINGDSSDQIQVSGKATIESSTFEIERYNTAASPVTPGKTYTIVTANGGLTVAEPTVAIADFPFIAFTLGEDGFNGYLTTSRSAERFAELASTPNEAAVANALDSATLSPAWAQVVGASTAQAQAAFSSLGNASIHASAASVLSEQSHFLRDAVLDRLRQDFPSTAAPAPAGSVLSYADAPAAAAVAAPPTKKELASVAPPGPVYAAWAQGLGSWGSLSGNSNVARTDDSIGGVISGVDVTINRMWRFGFAGGYTHSSFNSANIPASGSSDSYHMALYGGWQGGAWALRGGGAFGWNDIATSRQVTAVALGGAQNGSYDDRTWQVFAEGARSFALGPAALEPFANIAYVHVGGDVGETGLAAMSGSTAFDTTYTTLGVHGSYALPSSLTARATLGWRYAFGDVTPMTTLAFQPAGAAFALAGSPIARNALVTEIGVDYAVGPAATLGLAYSGQFASSASENSAKANFTLRF